MSKRQQSQRSAAGQESGRIRAFRTGQRQVYLRIALERMKPSHRINPYSIEARDALYQEVKALLVGDGLDPGLYIRAARSSLRSPLTLPKVAPQKAIRERMRKDLIELGVRSKQRSG